MLELHIEKDLLLQFWKQWSQNRKNCRQLPPECSLCHPVLSLRYLTISGELVTESAFCGSALPLNQKEGQRKETDKTVKEGA